MRVRLYNPPVHHYSGVHYRMNPPLGLPILASVLEGAGHDAAVVDLEALLVQPDKLARAYAESVPEWPDAVGFTVTTHNQRGARECIAALRDVGYDGYIALGGPHITVAAQDGQPSDLWGADVWVSGECEGNVVQVFERRETGVVEGWPLPIADVPGPLWAKHNPQPTYYMGNLPNVGKPEGIAMWSRGCPHNCIFCANPVFGHQRIRFRPPDKIAADMLALAELGVQSVFVYDDELVGMGGKQDEWLLSVCEAIKPLGLTWKCQGRCNKGLSAGLLRAMYDAGCRAIMWGVESFNDKVLKDIRKGITQEDIWYTLSISCEVGIGNWVFLMVGNYGESAADLGVTYTRLAKAVQDGLVQWRQVTVCTPVVGTELYDRAKAEGWLVEQPEAGPQMAQAYAPTPWLSTREMKLWRQRLLEVGA